jgi:hypothetical protein
MFPIEEETGGNGSLALALDAELKQHYDALLVMECADMGVYPANRGAVWFRSEARRTDSSADLSLVEAVAWGVLADAAAGRPDQGRIRSSAVPAPAGPDVQRHPRPVRRTSVAHQWASGNAGAHADAPKMLDRSKLPPSGRPAVCRATRRQDAGHPARDRQSRKWRRISSWRRLARMAFADRPRIERAHGVDPRTRRRDSQMGLHRPGTRAMQTRRETHPWSLSAPTRRRRLVLEGGQGFLPTHPIEAVQQRMADAFATGIRDYLESIGLSPPPSRCTPPTRNSITPLMPEIPIRPVSKHAIWAAGQANTIDPDAPCAAGMSPATPGCSRTSTRHAGHHQRRRRAGLCPFQRRECCICPICGRPSSSARCSCSAKPAASGTEKGTWTICCSFASRHP